MVSLRGHHLVCLHFFTGGGLGEEYRENHRRLLDRLAGGETVGVVAGADEVCRRCPHREGERCGWDEAAAAELDRLALAGLGTGEGGVLAWAELAGRVRSLAPLWWEEFCLGCDWAAFCARPR